MMDATLHWVLGNGASGQAAAALLRTEGASVRLIDQTTDDSLPPGAPHLAVISPGFRFDHPWLDELRGRGVALISEAELGLQRLRGPVLAVTGSLGKTTMVHLAALIAREAGKTVTLSGNVGTPVCEIAACTPEADLHVIELSSFQLEAFQTIEVDVGILLNVFPNHLDRHGSLSAYREAKLRLFRGTATAIAPLRFFPAAHSGRQISHGTGGEWGWEPGRILRKGKVWLQFQHAALNQPGLGDNLAALCAGLRLLGITAEEVDAGLAAFEPLSHRRERIPLQAPVAAINDSKSTCLAATAAALEGTAAGEGEIHLIAGGLGKGEDLSSLKEVLSASRPSVYLMGADAHEMKKVWTAWLSYCENHETLSASVRAAWKRCQPGDTVLLSPGCASFDQFDNYEQRGDAFKQEILELDRSEQIFTAE